MLTVVVGYMLAGVISSIILRLFYFKILNSKLFLVSSDDESFTILGIYIKKSKYLLHPEENLDSWNKALSHAKKYEERLNEYNKLHQWFLINPTLIIGILIWPINIIVALVVSFVLLVLKNMINKRYLSVKNYNANGEKDEI